MSRERTSLRFGSGRGMRRELRSLAYELFLAVRHVYGVTRLRSMRLELPLRLNLGSHEDVRPGWLNIDPFVLWRGTVSLDLREPLPFPDDCAEIVHAEHFVEHIGPGDAGRLIAECYRVLEPGGLISISVPDAEPALRAYADEDDAFFAEGLKSRPGDDLPTAIGELNWLFHMRGQHKYGYDEETLSLLLTDARFVDVGRRDFDPALDLEMRREGTLRLGGRKPT